jgi:predicted nucleotidyltransferase
MNRPVDFGPDNLARIQSILGTLLQPSATVWAFGSRATGTARRDSDLDLVIDIGSPLPRTLRHQLLDAFEASDLPYPVDLVDWQTISDDFRKLIAQDRVLVWGTEVRPFTPF